MAVFILALPLGVGCGTEKEPSLTLPPQSRELLSERGGATVFADPPWQQASAMIHARDKHAAIRLPGGKVLVLGGLSPDATAELYDPTLNLWSPAGMGAPPFQ